MPQHAPASRRRARRVSPATAMLAGTVTIPPAQTQTAVAAGTAARTAADTVGNLYRYSGTADGEFSPRSQIGSGWNGYKGIF